MLLGDGHRRGSQEEAGTTGVRSTAHTVCALKMGHGLGLEREAGETALGPAPG